VGGTTGSELWKEVNMANHKTLTDPLPEGGPMLDGAAPWVAVMSEYNGELFDFMSRRLAKDARAMRQLHDCRTLSDVSDLHAKWVQETMKDYSDEAAKLMSISFSRAEPGRRARH
jgi:hypothetical protein